MREIQIFFTNAFSGFGITDAVDIILVTFVVYYLLKLVLETRAEQIIKGILVLVAVTIISGALNLHTLNWMCKGALALGAVAVLSCCNRNFEERWNLWEEDVLSVDLDRGIKKTARE